MKLPLSGVPSAREENNLSAHSAVVKHFTPPWSRYYLPVAPSLIAARLFPEDGNPNAGVSHLLRSLPA